MTTRYLDLVGGNDANNGSSFALRKKTLSSAASGLTGGDTLRVMASPAATSMGQNATWTNASDTVTLASAVTANIDTCETAWTAATNITVTADTSTYREGTKGMTFASNGSFTTGLIAYHTMSSTDFSAYQQVSFMLRAAFFNQLTSGQIELKLCSDTVGAVPVNTISIAISGMTYSQWYALVFDTAAALGSAIQSVAVYAASTWTSKSFTIDNILACKAASAADSLTLNSYISKNTGNEAWYAVQSINGTTVKLWGTPQLTAALSAYLFGEYLGATGTVALYKREPIILTAAQSTSAAGVSPDSMLVMEGGYNTTDMSTKTDKTYVRSADPSVGCLVSAGDYVSLKSFGVHTGSNNEYALRFASVGGSTDDICINGGYYGIGAQSGDGTLLGLRYAVGCAVVLHLYSAWGMSSGPSRVTCDYAWGLSGANGTFTTFIEDSTTATSPFECSVDCADVQGFNYGINNGSSTVWTIRNTTFANVYRDLLTNNHAYYYNVTPSTGSGALSVALANHNLYYTKLNGDVAQAGVVIFASARGGNVLFKTATDQRHTASDVSWKFAFTSTISTAAPVSVKVASVACVASEQRTITLWMRRDSTNVGMQLRVRGGLVAGIASDLTAGLSAAINTWAQITLQFTPTEACVVDVLCDGWNSTGTTNGWIDDLGVA